MSSVRHLEERKEKKRNIVICTRTVPVSNLLCEKKYVRKVSSGFEYFLLIFAPESVLVLKVVVLNTEFNSASKGDVYKEGHHPHPQDSIKIRYVSAIVSGRFVRILVVIHSFLSNCFFRVNRQQASSNEFLW